MSITISDQEAQKIEDIVFSLIATGSAMAASPDDSEAPADLIQMTGADLIEAASDIIEILMGTEKSRQLLVEASSDSEKIQNAVDKLRGMDLDTIEEIIEEARSNGGVYWCDDCQEFHDCDE